MLTFKLEKLFERTSSTQFRWLFLACLCAACVAINPRALTAAEIESAGSLSQQNFVYTPNEMLNFDITAYIESNAPHLLNQAEAISHWSGRTTISPKIILSLLEHQSQSLSQNITQGNQGSAFSNLSNKKELSARIGDVATQLAQHYYQNLGAGIQQPEMNALTTLLNEKKSTSSKTVNDFAKTFFKLFPDALSKQKNLTTKESKAIPPNDLLQLPYPIGQAWQTWGGTHSFTGQNSGPRSSLDFRQNRGGFGSNTSNFWVSSSSRGSAVKHSSCFAEVVAPGGWSTTYYHLDNIQVNTGQSVARNARLANYADNLSQSLCDGGTSNGPHVHFSLKRNGVYVSLDKVKLSGYEVQDGRRDYDNDCRFFWLDDNGTKFCNGTPIPNRGVSVQPTLRPDLSISGLVIDKQELNINESLSASATLENVGTAQANASQLTFLLSNDSRITLGDAMLTVLATDALIPGANEDYSSDVISLPTPGSFWLGACVATVSGESNLLNNCSDGIPVTVKENKPLLLPSILLLLDEQRPK